MRIKLKDNKSIAFLDGSGEINTNDVMRQVLEVEPETPLVTGESLWIVYAASEFTYTGEILFQEEAGIYKMPIPEGVLKVPGEWHMQLFVRLYSTTDPTKYITQLSSDIALFTVQEGLPVEDGQPINSATIGNLWNETKKNAETASAKAADAVSAAEAAVSSASSANNSAISAEHAADEANKSEVQAEYYALQAEQSKTAASESKAGAAIQALNAQTYASQAKSSASAAFHSEAKAEESASFAASYESGARVYNQGAQIANSEAKGAATAAKTSETNAAASEAEAKTAAQRAETAAAETETLYHFRGSVQTYQDLPTNAVQGDTYNVIEAYGDFGAGTNFAWNGATWDSLGGIFDTTALASKDDLSEVEGKVDLHGQRIDKSLGKQAQTIVCPHEACITGSGDEAFLDIDDGYVTVDKIQGKTVSTTNLIPYPYAYPTDYTNNGVNFTVNSDGTITANGTATGGNALYYLSSSYTVKTPEKSYFSGCPSGGGSTTFSIQAYTREQKYFSDIGSGFLAPANSELNIVLIVSNGMTVNNLVFKPMLNVGTEAKPYSKWFAGLKNASFEKIVSTGRNLIDLSGVSLEKTVNGITFTKLSDGQYRVTGTIADPSKGASPTVTIKSGKVYPAGVYSTARYTVDGKDIEFFASAYSAKTGVPIRNIDGANININEDFVIKTAGIYVNRAITGAIDLTVSTMLNIGNSVLPYEPYHADASFAFTEPQDNGEWNTLNITAGKIEKQWAEKVFDGTENWMFINGSYRAFYVTLPAPNNTPSICSNGYERVTAYTNLSNKKYIINANQMSLNDEDYSTVDEWKAHLAELAAAGNPLTVRYKTVEITETELPSIATNKYAVVKGGLQYVDTGVSDSPYNYGAYNTIIKNYAVDPIGQIFYNADMNKSQQTEIDALKADKQDALTFDDTPTAESANPVTSGGIHAALEEKADKTALAELAAEVADNRNILREAKVFTVATVEDTYTTRETAGGEPNLIDGSLTSVKEIRGKTVATENLIPYPYGFTTGVTRFGITATINADNSVTLNGTWEGDGATRVTDFDLINKKALRAGTYTVSGCPSGGSTYKYRIIASTHADDGTVEYNFDIGSGVTFVMPNNGYINIFIRVGDEIGTVNNLVFRPMLNAGTTAKPYSKWFAGLKNASFEKIVSTGRNLIDPATIISGYISDADFTISGNKNIYRSIKCYLPAGKYTLQSSVAINIIRTMIDGNYLIVSIGNLTSYTFTTTQSGYVGISFRREDDTNWVDDTNIWLVFSNTATAYEPYISDTLSADTPIELAEYDVAFPETGETKRQSNTLTFDGTEEWYLTGNAENNFYNYRYYTPISVEAQKTKVPCICNKYDYNVSVENDTRNDIGILVIRGYVYIRLGSNSTIKNAAEWKAHLAELAAAGNPVTVTYKTAEATTESTPFNKSKYKAWKNCSETIEQGLTDNSEYGAITTVKQEFSKLIPKEETV